jgi:IS4 transposase
MKGAGDKPSDGKRKGGAKVHVLLDAHHDLPRFVTITEARVNDKRMLNQIELPPSSIIVFDRAYRNYKMWQKYTDAQVSWVTRTIGDETYNVALVREVSQTDSELGVITDQDITLGSGINKNVILAARMVKYKDPVSHKELIFITNNRLLAPIQIADIYKKRWQIEVFFKRLKRHSPLRYFLGNNENAIKIQIWCSLILDLLTKVIQTKIKSKKWSFTNLSSILKHHAMNYFDLIKFLMNPINSLIQPPQNKAIQLELKI